MQNTITKSAAAVRILDTIARARRARRHSPAPRYSIHVPGFGLVGYYDELPRVLDALRYLPAAAYVCDADGIPLER